MFQQKNINNTTIFFIFIAALVFIVFNEAVYVFSHRDILSSYILKSAKIASSIGNTKLGFFILTEGKENLPGDVNFEKKVQNYLESSPDIYDLARVDYDIAILASKSNFPNLTPGLLEVAIERDPDFSFWRVELANYYLSVGENIKAEAVLTDCVKIAAPRQHCLDYKNSDFVSNTFYSTGFLTDSINTFYRLHI